MCITAGEARKSLLKLIEKVNDDRAPVEIAVSSNRSPKRRAESTASSEALVGGGA